MPKQIINRMAGNRATREISYLGKLSFQRQIHAEIAPKLQAIRLAEGNTIETCPFDISPFNSYEAKGTMGEVQVTCGKGSRYKETFSQGRQTEPDLANTNSRTFETPEHEMVPDNAKN